MAIFFAISGYYFEKSTGGIYLIKKRLLKLWPAYFCAITLIFIFTRRIGLPGRTVSFENYLLNIPFINGFLSKPYVDGAHWFLTTLVGCLICYSIINQMENTKRMAGYYCWVILSIIVMVVLRSVSAGMIRQLLQTVFTLLGGAYLPFMIIGTAYSIEKKKNDSSFLGKGLIVLASVEVLMGLGLYALVIYYLTLLVLARTQSMKLKFLEIESFKYLGKISYSVYLIHQNLGFLIINQIVEIKGRYHVWMSIIVLIMMIFIGGIFYKIIEEPVNNTICKILVKGEKL